MTSQYLGPRCLPRPSAGCYAADISREAPSPGITDANDYEGSSRERLRIEHPFSHISAVNLLVEILPSGSQRTEEPAGIVRARGAVFADEWRYARI
jgi:hypothetical protein